MKNKNLIVKGIRYVPAIALAAYVTHVGLLIVGVDTYYAEAIVHLLVNVLLWLLSCTFGFCLLHKMMIAYVILVDACIVLQRFDVWGNCLNVARVIVFLIGIALCVWAYWKRHSCKCKHKSE